MTRKLKADAESGACCTPRPALKDRPLLSFVQGVKVAALFKLLGNDTRVRLLHHIVRSGEATVTDMAKTLGMKPQAVSNQLVRLSDTGMLASRRDGNNVHYRVQNNCVAPLLDLALCLMDEGDAPKQETCDVED
jgi:ArsR family transcriptional regulator, lead/cadmium/zinc/bismuth-responsive transcriptional repressor